MANQVIVTKDHTVQVSVQPTPQVQVQINRNAITSLTNVDHANTANYATNVTGSNQPNITSLGTLATLNVSNIITTTNLNVTGNFQVGNLVANSANYANYAGIANTANVAVIANTANVAYSVSGANVVGTVANANYSIYAGNANTANSATIANISNVAYSVNAANVVGTVANANYAAYAGNVSGTVANANYASYAGNANIANVANSVNVANVVGIGNIATLNLDGNSGNILYGNGAFSAIPNVSNVGNANYANFAGTAYNVSGSNVSGVVANANYASYAGNANIANTANSVAGANVSGIVANANFASYSNLATYANILIGNTIANANYATIAGTAYSVSGANVSGTVANANYSAYAGNATIANTANSVAGANVSGVVANANYAAYAGNVSGTVANANYAAYAGNATIANTANSVAGANVSGIVANANYSAYSGNATIANTANAVAGANVSGTVANANFASYSNLASYANVLIGNSIANANYANFSGTVITNAQPNITSVGNLTGLNVNDAITLNNIASINQSGTVTRIQSNPNNDVTGVYLDNNDVGVLYANTGVLLQSSSGNQNYEWLFDNTANVQAPNNLFNVVGNVGGNYFVGNGLNLANGYVANTPGQYYTQGFNLIGNTSYNIPSFDIYADTTEGSNVLQNVSIISNYGSNNANLQMYSDIITNTGIAFSSPSGGYAGTITPAGTTITNVDYANNTMTLSNVATATLSQTFAINGALLNITSANLYNIVNPTYLNTATSTVSAGNLVVVDDISSIDNVGQGQPIQFYGNVAFGNLNIGTVYYVNNIDDGNSGFTVSLTPYGSDVALTDSSGNLAVVALNPDNSLPVAAIPVLGTYAWGGPFVTAPVFSDYTQVPTGQFTTPPSSISYDGYKQPLQLNANYPSNPENQLYTQVSGYGLVVGAQGTPTLTGTIGDSFVVTGVSTIHTGTDANAVNTLTQNQIIYYSDNGTDSANIVNPGRPASYIFSTSEGNINNPTYLSSGRSLGRIGWYGTQNFQGDNVKSPGSSPVASIIVQTLGDWNDQTNQSLPMVMAFQYSPLNATTGGGSNYFRINRTFLQAANNTTTIGGASVIEFKPLPTSGSGTNNRSPSGLGNVSINPQTFANIGGYVQGDATGNGQGSLLTVSTTDPNWNGNVGIRLDRTVYNTANIEFVLPSNQPNKMNIVDNNVGRTAASVNNGFFCLPSYTAAALRALTGEAGALATVSDGGNKVAYWGNSAWYYVFDNSAV